jgi:hypothetical protein
MDFRSHLPVILAKAGIHAAAETIFGRRVIVFSTMDSRLRGNDEVIRLFLRNALAEKQKGPVT